jgi:hypothetical protein
MDKDELAGEDVMERWERQRPKPQRPPRPRGPTIVEVEQMRAGDWARFVDGRIAAALAVHDAIRLEVLGQVIAQERNKHREAIAQLRADLELRLDALAQELVKQRALADGELVDLLLPLRKRDAAA